MNINELEIKAKEVNKNSDALSRKYRNIINSLSRIYSIIRRSDAFELKAITNLIDDYNEVLNLLDKQYGEGATALLSYVNATRKNIYQLTTNLKTTYNMYDDTLIENKE